MEAKLIIIAIMSISLLACYGNSKNNPNATSELPIKEDVKQEEHKEIGIPIIDVTKKYPKKEIKLQDIANVTYIPLETSDKVLLDKDGIVGHISDNKIIMYNSQKGDVFFFDGKGKIISHFNHRGQSGQEYQVITDLIYDEANKEVIIMDYLVRQRFLIYDENGKFKRMLPFPKGCWFHGVMNYDNQTLIAYENYNTFDQNNTHLARKKPYLLLSKKDGSIVSEIDLKVKERVSTSFRFPMEGGGSYVVRISSSNLLKNKNDFILAEIASDTLFAYTPQKKLVPLAIRKPEILSMNDPKTVLLTNFISSKYIVLSTFRNEYKLPQAKELSSTSNVEIDFISLLIDRTTNEIFEYKLINNDFPTHDKAGTFSYRRFFSYELIDALEAGKLSGKLREIAQKTDIDDNPVLMIVKLKE